jgi:hypothetical protein
MKRNAMRCYHFNNMYMHGIHAGIQSKHSGDEVTLKYLATKSEGQGVYARDSYLDWMANHKTVVVLNGGMHGDLVKIEAFLSSEDNPYAWAPFRESEYALNNALTNIAIVLPEHIYAYKEGVIAAGEFIDAEEHVQAAATVGVQYFAGKGYVSIRRDVPGKGFQEDRCSRFDLELIRLMASMRLM